MGGKMQPVAQQSFWDFGAMAVSEPSVPPVSSAGKTSAGEHQADLPNEAGDAAPMPVNATPLPVPPSSQPSVSPSPEPCSPTAGAARLLDLTGVPPEERAAVIAMHLPKEWTQGLSDLIHADPEEWQPTLIDWALVHKGPFRVADACKQVAEWYRLDPKLHNHLDLKLLKAMKQFWGAVASFGLAQVVETHPPIYVKLMI